MIRKYGLKPDPKDSRDLKYSPPMRLVSIPAKVDLREFDSPVEDQGYLGSCTGQAFAGALEYLDRRKDCKHTDVSRLFIYYNERMLEGTINEDSGAIIRDGIKALQKWGACDESLWPYDISKYTEEPPPEAYKDGEKRRIISYYRISDLRGFKEAIAEGLSEEGPAIVFGVKVLGSFDSEQVTKTGVVPMPAIGERDLGGHCLKGSGYDDTTRYILAKNSYGKENGDGGYLYIPYDYIDDPSLTWDIWAIYGKGLPCLQEERYDPMPADTKWYIPITSIVKVIGTLWNKLFGSKQSNKEDSR